MYFGLIQIVEAASSSPAVATAPTPVAEGPRSTSPRRLREYPNTSGDGTRLPDYSHLPKFRDSVQRMKIRVKLACSNCKASKTKCDDERPCRRCARTDRAATCSDAILEPDDDDELARDTQTPVAQKKQLHDHSQARAAAGIYQMPSMPAAAMVTSQQQQQQHQQHQQQQQQSMMNQNYMMMKMPLMPGLGAFPGMNGMPFNAPSNLPSMWHHPQQQTQPVQEQPQPTAYQPQGMQGNIMSGLAPINSMLKPVAPIQHSLTSNLTGLQRPDISTLQSCLHLTASQPPHNNTFQQFPQPPLMQMAMPQQNIAAGMSVNNNPNAINIPSPPTPNSTLSLSGKHPSVSTSHPPSAALPQQDVSSSSSSTLTVPTLSVPAKNVNQLDAPADDRPTKKIKSEDGTPTPVPLIGDVKPAANGMAGAVSKEQTKPSAVEVQPSTPVSKPPTPCFSSPLTAPGRQYLEALVTVGLPHLHTWIARLQSESDAAAASPAQDADTTERRALQMKRIDWLRSFFRFMHGNTRSTYSSGSGDPKNSLPSSSSTRSISLPKSLYTNLALGVLLIPLGTEETTEGDVAPWVNESLAQLLGYQQAQLEQLLCSIDGLASLHHPSNLTTFLPQLIDAVMNGVSSYATKSKWKHAQGHWIEVLESLNLTYHPTAGHVEYVASLMQAIANPTPSPGPAAVQAQPTYNPSVMLSMVQAGLANGMSLQAMSQAHSSYMPSLPISSSMMSSPTFSQGFGYPQMMGYPMQPAQPSPYGPMSNGMPFNVQPSYGSFGYPASAPSQQQQPSPPQQHQSATINSFLRPIVTE